MCSIVQRNHSTINSACLITSITAKVCVDIVHSRRNRGKRSAPLAVQDLRDEAKAVAYCKCLSQLLKERPHNPTKPSDWNWQTLKSCVVEATERAVGVLGRKSQTVS